MRPIRLEVTPLSKMGVVLYFGGGGSRLGDKFGQNASVKKVMVKNPQDRMEQVWGR